MNQDKHLFQFTGAAIASACAAEETYHRERLEYWRGEQQKLVDEARGLTAVIRVVEQQVTGGKRVSVVADITGAQEINWKLTTAGEKIDTHRRQADDFKLKGAAYATQAARAYELDPTDVAYFRLNGGDRNE